MAIQNTVPFYENTADDTHCVQACYRMVLKHFIPGEEYTWEELDVISAKQENMWTWPMAGLMWLREKGFEIKYIEDFDYAAFLDRKGEYLKEKYGEEVATEQIRHSDIEAEAKWVSQFLDTIDVDNRPAELQEVFSYLSDGYLVIAAVNYRSLHDQDGYVGHFVVVTGFDDENIFLNEPGRPGIENWKISHDQFVKGWSFPDKTATNLIAIRLKK